jgi:hypothetical protein
MEEETLLIFKAIAKTYADEQFGGYEPSYSSHGEDFRGLYEEYKTMEEDKFNNLINSYLEIKETGKNAEN